MRVLLIGGYGQLGKELLPLVSDDKDLEILNPTSTELNLLNDSLIKNYIEKNKPDIIVNLSAYTKVDLAEEQSELALMSYFEGIKSLGMSCYSSLIPLIHFSTDYVFGD